MRQKRASSFCITLHSWGFSWPVTKSCCSHEHRGVRDAKASLWEKKSCELIDFEPSGNLDDINFTLAFLFKASMVLWPMFTGTIHRTHFEHQGFEPDILKTVVPVKVDHPTGIKWDGFLMARHSEWSSLEGSKKLKKTHK